MIFEVAKAGGVDKLGCGKMRSGTLLARPAAGRRSYFLHLLRISRRPSFRVNPHFPCPPIFAKATTGRPIRPNGSFRGFLQKANSLQPWCRNFQGSFISTFPREPPWVGGLMIFEVRNGRRKAAGTTRVAESPPCPPNPSCHISGGSVSLHPRLLSGRPCRDSGGVRSLYFP